MKNSECQIYIETKNTRSVFAKEGDHWVVTSSQGRHFTATAEQVLSHILPPLAGVSKAKVTVVKRK
jgi:thiamine biosynthesis lipoprotein ApbE